VCRRRQTDRTEPLPDSTAYSDQFGPWKAGGLFAMATAT